MEHISAIQLFRINLPLKVPYRLSFGDQKSFDCVLVKLTLSSGNSGWGEATLLPGYTDETVKDSWSLSCEIAPQLIKKSLSDANTLLNSFPKHKAFTLCTFRTAWQHAENHPILQATGHVPLLGAVNEKASNTKALETEINQLIQTGYSTLKIKVGFDVENDLRDIKKIKSIVAGRAKLRIDANQGYTIKEGIHFVESVTPDDVELIEQPCKAGDWEAAVATKKAAQAPMMLDESIYGIDDIYRAADLNCADYIKLKLMKMPGLNGLIEGLKRIRACGMQPVLGNGVATDLSCWFEACIASQYVKNAGEMNGFLRPIDCLLKNPLEVKDSVICLDGQNREIDTEKLKRYILAQCMF